MAGTRGQQPAPGIRGAVFVDGPAKSGKSMIFGKSGPVKAPIYLDIEDLAKLSAAGFDPSKPVQFAFWQD